MSARGRQGFTLVELLVVTVVGTVLLLAAYETLLTNRMTYTAHRLNLEGRQALRASAQVLTGELREISIGGGDLLEIDPNSIKIRSSASMALVCALDYAQDPLHLRLLEVTGNIRSADSVVVLADNDPEVRSDDVWLTGPVTASSSANCPDGADGVTLNVADLGTADSIRVGAPIRAYEHHTYQLMTINDKSYLAMARGTGTPEPVVGPLGGPGRPGMTLEYFDGSGNTTTVPADVTWIQVTLRTPVSRVGQGRAVQDSMVVRVHPRN